LYYSSYIGNNAPTSKWLTRFGEKTKKSLLSPIFTILRGFTILRAGFNKQYDF